MIRRLILLLVLLCACAAATLRPGPALAHAALVTAMPADGAVMARAPEQFTLSFSEPVSPLVLRLISPDGATTTLERFTLRDRTLTIEAPTELAQGSHVLSWRVVSEDGHPIGGSVVFSVGAPGARPPEASAQRDLPVTLALWLGRVGLYLGLVLGIGGVAFPAWVGPLPASSRKPLRMMLVLGLVVVPFALAAQGLDALAAPASDALRPEIWRAAIGSSFGRTAAIATAALLAGLISLSLAGGAGRALAFAALLGTGLALAASGHASAASPQWLMRPAVFLHGISMTAWAGALLPLALAMREANGAAALKRFSRRVPLFLIALLASGVALAIVQVETPGALLTSAYGLVLTVKLALVAALLGLAAFNRYRLTAPASRSVEPAKLRLRRVIGVEIAVVLAILGTAALWRFTPPPRTLVVALAAAAPASVHIHSEKAMAEISVTPGRAGPASVSIALLDGNFGPLAAKEVRLSFANRTAGIEAVERPAARQPDGSWLVDGLTVPVAGRWSVELEILVSDFEMIRLSDTIEIKP
ncbi:copper resistance CopC/CopD family protein [Bosea rubneri]|uniref:Copper resistance protein CopC n=1 Tax=Bosea rubneri TaxID=3075434 RepID=A0ABU3S978_9HYPH|nr:copper resistance protein CopC [Bosea sp. ZW T0_25]MDU0340947.1 copper resistance protein CopC [Bosea sp. ZW T0_25]